MGSPPCTRARTGAGLNSQPPATCDSRASRAACLAGESGNRGECRGLLAHSGLAPQAGELRDGPQDDQPQPQPLKRPRLSRAEIDNERELRRMLA